MSDSWRITTLFNNKTGKVLPSAGSGIGATTIRASRGTAEPMYFDKGETAKILELCGLPNPDYPDILEVIEFNKSYPLWVSAPTVNGRNGGVFVGPTGSFVFEGGVSSIPSNDTFTAWEVIELLGTGDGSVASFGATLGHKTYYNNQSVEIIVDGTVENISAADSAVEILTGDNGTGTYNRSTGAVDYTFDTAPADDARVEVKYTINISGAAFFALVCNSPQTDNLAVKISYDDDTEIFTIHLYEVDALGNYTEKDDSPYEVSLDEEGSDGFGRNIYIEAVFDENPYITPVVNTTLTVSTFTDDTSEVDFDGGYRGSDPSGSTLVAGYDYFYKTNTYEVDIFFDATADSAVPAKFVTLRNSYHKYSRFILPLTLKSAASAITDGVSVSNKGLSFYWNWGLVRNDYNTTANIWTPLTGEIAKKHADIIVGAFGGLAAAWVDENGFGGQLGSGRVIKLYDEASETQLQQMDTARINPIVDDPAFGPMIVSRRTSLSSLSDYSFTDYVGAIDYIIRNINQQVLPYQLVKLNDTAHRNIVANKCDSIIAPMTVEPVNVIRDYAIKCDEENNNDAVLEREEFRLAIAIKVTPKSRTIVLTFINTPQGSNVTEQFQ